MFSMPEGLPDQEPTPADLAAIEEEWLQIETEMTALDAEIRALWAAETVNELDVRRLRRARRRVLRAPLPQWSWGGGEVA